MNSDVWLQSNTYRSKYISTRATIYKWKKNIIKILFAMLYVPKLSVKILLFLAMLLNIFRSKEKYFSAKY